MNAGISHKTNCCAFGFSSIGQGWFQQYSCTNLAQLGPAAWKAVPALAAGLKSPDRAIRDVSVRALGALLFSNSDESQPNYRIGVKAM